MSELTFGTELHIEKRVNVSLIMTRFEKKNMVRRIGKVKGHPTMFCFCAFSFH